MENMKIAAIVSGRVIVSTPTIRCAETGGIPDRAFMALEEVDCSEAFSRFLQEFNNEYCTGANPLYRGVPNCRDTGLSRDLIADNKDDHLYVKNISGRDCLIKAKSETGDVETIRLCDNGVCVLHRGYIDEGKSIGAEIIDSSSAPVEFSGVWRMTEDGIVIVVDGEYEEISFSSIDKDAKSRICEAVFLGRTQGYIDGIIEEV